MHLTKRQKEIFDFIQEHLEQEGYAPSLEEIGERFGLSSVATVHKHVQNLVDKGLLRKAWNRSRSLELATPATAASREIPMLGTVAAGVPVEAMPTEETISVPEDLVGSRDCFALQVRGDSMMDDHIVDGDLVIVEARKTPRDGETVVALIRRDEVTLKHFHREGNEIRLVPANARLRAMTFPAEDIEVQGVVVGLLRRY